MNLSWLIAVACMAIKPASPLTLQQALDQKRVEVSVTSNPTGTHYLHPVIMRIKNKGSDNLNVLVENGRTFAPADSNYQPILVIQEAPIALAPGEEKEIKIQGMCFNEHKAAPSGADMVYRITPLATGKLADIAKYLQSKNLDGYSAQRAIWCVSNGADLEDIADWDEQQGADLCAYVAGLVGKPVPARPSPDDYRRSLRARAKVEVGGSFEYTLLKPTEIHIAMFDANGIVVRELFYQEAQPRGDYKFDYSFDASVYTDPVYFIRYLENKEVFMEFEMTM